MKQSSRPYLTALTSVLLAGKVCLADDALAEPYTVPKDESALVPGLFRQGGANISDLTRTMFTSEPVEGTDGGDKPKQELDFKFYDVMLLAFVKCNKAWVESWFPNKDELDKLNVLKPLSGDHTYFLRYEEEGNKRLAVDVSSNWVKDTFFAQGWQIDMDVSPWWNWAALQGAYDGHYDGKVAKLDMYGIVLGISGETLEEAERHDNKDDYWDLLTNAHRTPIWVDYQGDWHVAMQTNGTGPGDGYLWLGSVSTAGFVNDPVPYSKVKEDMISVWQLKGLPVFPEDHKRKGDLKQ